MKYQPKPILWFKVTPKQGKPYEVWLTCDELDEDLEGNSGRLVYETRRILINVVDPPYEQEDTVLHELLHAALSWADLPAETEEYCVAQATPHLLHFLRQSSKIKFPKRPEGYTRLARFARRNILP